MANSETLVTSLRDETVSAAQDAQQYAELLDDSATLDWNFATGKYARDNGERVETTNLGDLATVTRPDTKQVVGPNGFQRTAVAGAVARQWNPVTGEAEGVVQEKASKNLLKFSESFGASGWTKYGVASTTASEVSAPDGNLSANTLNAETYQNRVYQKVFFPGGPTVTLSFFVRSNGNGSSIAIRFNSHGGTYTEKIEDVDLTDEWQRVSVTLQTSVDNEGVYAIIYGLAGTPSFDVWGAQLEKGDKPTSYIPTPATFTSRASTGTYFDSNGVLQTAAIDEPRENHALVDGEWVSQGLLIEPEAKTNKLLWSEAFDNAAWVKARATITANSITAPDGTVSADKLVEDAATSVHSVRQTENPASTTTTYNAFFILKAGERSFAFVGIAGDMFGGALPYISVDLSTGVTSVANATPDNYGAKQLNDGWWLVWLSATTGDSGSNITPEVRISPDGDWANRSYTGDGTSGLYLWGAQLEEGTQPSSYIKTTDAPVTRAADVVSSVEVERAQDELSATLDAEYNPRQGTWVIDAEHNDVAPLTGIGLDGAYTSGKGKLVYSYDENGGEAFANGAKVFDTPPVKKAQTVGLGHQTTGRVQYFPKKLPVAQAIARATGSVAVDYPFADGRSMSFDFVNQDYGTRSLTNAVDVKRSSNLVDLFPEYSRLSPATYWDANGVLRTAGINEPRYDHDPITGEARGFLQEGSATNIITINHDLTRLTTQGSSSIAAEPSVIGPDGKTGRVVRVSGADIFNNRIERYHGNAATNLSDTWTSGVLVRAVSGSVDFILVADDGSGNYNTKRATVGEQWEWIVTDGSDGNGFAASTSLTRMWRIYGQTGDLYIAGAQLEEGTRASSFIYTEDAPVTRAAGKPIRTLGAEFNTSEGVFLWRGVAKTPDSTTYTRLFNISDGTANNRYEIFRNTAGAVDLFVTPGNVTVGINPRSDNIKVALRYSLTAVSLFVNGEKMDMTIDQPDGLGQLRLGYSTVTGNLNGFIEFVRYSPLMLSDAELRALTAL